MNPELLSPGQVANLHPNPDGRCRIRRGNLEVKVGQVVPINNDKRSIISANNTFITYILLNPKSPHNGKIFRQTATGFGNDFIWGAMSKGARSAKGIAKLAEYEIEFLLGVASSASLPMFLSVCGTDLLRFFLVNRKDFTKWRHAIEVVLEVRKTLLKVAPTLYEKLIDKVLVELWRSVKNLPEAMINDPKIAGRALGVIFGKLGSKARKIIANRLSALSIIWTILWTLVTKSVSGIRGAVMITIDQKKKAAADIINELKKAEVKLDAEDAKKIVNEVINQPEKLKDSLKKLNDAFQLL